MKKRILNLVISICMVITMMPTAAFAGSTDPTVVKGSWQDVADTSWYDANETTFTITTAEQLAGLAKLVNAMDFNEKNDPMDRKTILLGADIDLSGKEWVPIGYCTPDMENRVYFSGCLDGQNHTISGIYINQDKEDHVGLFAKISSIYSEVKNVKMDGGTIIGNDSVGSIAGEITRGNVTDCTSSVYVYGHECVGGIVGEVSDSNIKNCEFTGTVTGTYGRIGGIVGEQKYGNIADCTNRGKVAGISKEDDSSNGGVGGILGVAAFAWSELNVVRCSNYGDISGDIFLTGGIVGDSYPSYGRTNYIYKCYNEGTINVTSNAVGGVVGSMDDNTIVHSCYNTGQVNGRDQVGGVVGWAENGSVINCYNKNTVVCQTNMSDLYSFSAAGGVVGDLYAGTVESCYNEGSVYGVGDKDIAPTNGFTVGTGGVVGLINSYEKNTETGVTDCYNIGDVYGSNNTGGVVGAVRIKYSEIFVDNSYNVGKIYEWSSASESAAAEGTKVEVGRGGIIGFAVDDRYDVVSNCFYLEGCNADGVTFNNEVGSAITEDQFAVQETFTTEPSSWDFAETWKYEEGIKRPVLGAKKMVFPIKYSINGREVKIEGNPNEYTADDDDIVITNPPTWMGFIFTGWNGTDLNGFDNMTITIPSGSFGARSYYSNWEPKGGYSVTFNPNGGQMSGETVKNNVKWNERILENLPEPTTLEEGFEFDGWKYGDRVVEDYRTYGDLAGDDTKMSIELVAQWKDVVAPTGSLQIGENTWTELQEEIKFDLSYNKAQEMTITASDNSDEVEISYLLSGTVLDEETLKTASFTKYSEQTLIAPGYECVVYVKLTDKGGNTTYLSSNGILIDDAAPVITGVTNGETYCAAQTVTVTDDNLDTVTVNGNPVTLNANGQFTLNPAEGAQEIVATDKLGNVSDKIIVTVKNGHFGGEATCLDKAVCDACQQPYGETDPDNHTKDKIWSVKTETQHKQEWECCHKVTVALENHDWVNGVCDDCEYVRLHTVNFDSDGGSDVSTKTDVKWSDKVLEGVATPTAPKEGFEFNGWKFGDTAVTKDTTYGELAGQTSTSITLKAQWKDIAAPTGEIQLGTNKWTSLLNKITFGLFFKDTQDVTITASDNSGKNVEIKYFLSETALSDNGIAAADYVKYTGKVSLSPDQKVIVYAKLTDETGNITYICSNGLVFDATAPVVAGVTNGTTYCAAQTVKVTDDNLDKVTVNGNIVTLNADGQFILNPAEGTQEIVAVDKAGNASAKMVVTVKEGHTPKADDGNCMTAVECEFCGEIAIEAKSEHSWSDWTAVDSSKGRHEHKCTVDGCEASETENCMDEVAPFTRCDKCGADLFVPSPTPVQKPEIKIDGDNGSVDSGKKGDVEISDDGTTIIIKPNEGYEVGNVTVNGKDLGAVSEVTGMKTGDKVIVIFKMTAEAELEMITEKLSNMKFTARSEKTAKKNILVTIKPDAETAAALEELENQGYSVKYKFYRSVKKTSGYKPMQVKNGKTYLNTTGIKGAMYYYKVRVMVYDNAGNLVAKSDLKQCSYANRRWTR